jgi:hypothetical protein
MTSVRARLILVATVALLGVGLVVYMAVGRTANTVTVLQLNICHSGKAGCYTGDAVMTMATAVIRAKKPQVLSVDEACSGDVETFQQAMGPTQALFVPALQNNGAPTLCNNGQPFGDIIMVAAGSAGTTGRFAAQDGGDELRVWACLRAGKSSVCTTHLSSDSGTTALAQCKELLTRAAGYARPTIIAGDMNLRYQGSPDVQDCNPDGFYRKGDGDVQHVFASTDFAFVSGTKIDMAGTTDHPGLLVTAIAP